MLFQSNFSHSHGFLNRLFEIETKQYSNTLNQVIEMGERIAWYKHTTVSTKTLMGFPWQRFVNKLKSTFSDVYYTVIMKNHKAILCIEKLTNRSLTPKLRLTDKTDESRMNLFSICVNKGFDMYCSALTL